MANLSQYDQTSLFGANVQFADLLDSDDLCFTVQKEIAPLLKDSDFEEMYKGGGRPPISPRVLALTLLMQYLEKLSDRAACFNLKFRLDWKIAFGLPMDFAGIHPTTLVYFRERLLANQKATWVFDQILKHLKSCGLVKKGGKQRIDSTHLVASVRELTRIELLHETLRLFCLDISAKVPSMDGNLASAHERYVDKISTYGITDIQKKEFIRGAGLAMRGFITWANQSADFEIIGNLSSFCTLKTVFSQNFVDAGQDKDPELIRVATGRGHVCTPHDPEARYANKGKKGWLGYKGQVVETINGAPEERVSGDGNSGNLEKDPIPNFITYIDVQEATDFDGDCVQPVVAELGSKGIAPGELYGDTHYNTAANIEALQNDSIELKGPVQPVSREAIEKNAGFSIDLDRKVVNCPAGVESKHFHSDPNGKIGASFPKASCLQCSRRNICKPEPRGKYFTGRPENKMLTQRREQMKDTAYLRDLQKRNGIEGTLSGLVRGQGWRRSRFCGLPKTRLQAKFTAAAANVTRLHRRRLIENRKRAIATANKTA